MIYRIDKVNEWVEIQNGGGTPQSLIGWKLVSERDSQECPLPSINLLSGHILRIWTLAGAAGPNDADCGLSGPIWDDNELDPAVLYNDLGVEVDREPPG